MQTVHYPARALLGLGTVALLSLYASFSFYSQQIRRHTVPQNRSLVPMLIVSLLSSTAIGYLLAWVLLPVYKPAWTDLLLKVSLGAGLGAGVTSGFYFLTRIL